MHPLSAQDILHVWEAGQQQHPLDRALTMLLAARPDLRREEVAACSLGQRDRELLDLREYLFGPTLTGLTHCPQCHQPLEFAFTTTQIRAAGPTQDTPNPLVFEFEDIQIQYRLPNSYDLAALANSSTDLSQARHLLLQRCILQVTRSGQSLPLIDLAPTTLSALSTDMLAHDPHLETTFTFQCPMCTSQWQTVFDIGAYLWTELSDQAKRLLNEVNILARNYGWREADILAMSSTRRRTYLAMVLT